MYNGMKISKFPPPWNFKFTFECVKRYEDNRITTPMERQIHLECVQWLEDIKIPDPILTLNVYNGNEKVIQIPSSWHLNLILSVYNGN